jgi:hypothetical protein
MDGQVRPSPGPGLGAPINSAWVEAVALRVVELMRNGSPPSDRRLVDAATLATELGVTRAWIYEHRDELGVVRLGTGTKPCLRFDVETARRALVWDGDKALSSSIPAGDRRTARRRNPQQRSTTAAGSILASRPRRTA